MTLMQPNAGLYLPRLQELTGKPEWPESTALQIQAIQMLREACLLRSAEDGDMALHLGERLACRPERVLRIAELDSYEDMHDALRVKQRLPRIRLPGEDGYPNRGEGWLGEYLHWADEMEVPLAWHYWAALSLVAAACRWNFYHDAGGGIKVRPGIYVVLTGPSGEGKTLCITTAKSLLLRTNQLIAENKREGWDDRINLIADKLTPPMLLEELQTSFTAQLAPEMGEDGSPKKVKPVLLRRPDSSGILIADELVNLIGKGQFGHQQWVDLLLAVSNGQPEYYNPTQRSRRVLERLSLTCLFGSTPDQIRRDLPATFISAGLMGRCVWIYRESADRCIPTPDPLDPLTRDILAERLVELARSPLTEIPMTGEALEWWHDYYLDWFEAKQQEPQFAAWHNRSKEQLRRTGMLIALANGQRCISLACLKQAQWSLDVERQRLEALFSKLRLNSKGEYIQGILDAIPAGEFISERDLTNKVQHLVGSTREITTALELLLAAGQIARGHAVDKRNRKPTGSPMRYWRRRRGDKR